MNFKLFSFVVLSFLLNTELFSQNENMLIQRSFWKGSPSLTTVKKLVADGHSPTELTIYGFDAVTYAILEKAPMNIIQYFLNDHPSW